MIDDLSNDLKFIIHVFHGLFFFPHFIMVISIIEVESKKNFGVPSSCLAASFSHVCPSYCLSPAHILFIFNIFY